MNKAFIHATASVGKGVNVAAGVRIWARADVGDGATIGENSILGMGVHVGMGVEVGSNCKVQDGALLYAPCRISDGVFVGPRVILTNDEYPRAVTPEGNLKSAADWVPAGVHVESGAAIGAGAVCVAPVQIGSWALVGAGSVVTKDVLPFSIVVGNPARHVGWVGRAGFPLENHGAYFVCPNSGAQYVEIQGQLSEVSW